MQPSSERPVVFLAFANAPDAHLKMLKTESREVYRALQLLEQEGNIAVHREESSEFDELYEDLLRHDQRIVIFHYAGHADGTMLELEGGAGGARGIARLLGQQTGLKLVFLNGCATKGHVTLLLKAGVPAVIATSVPIGDRKAQEFSVAFYAALSEGRSISQAFESASAYIDGKHDVDGGSGINFSRSFDWGDDEAEENDEAVLEWGLYTNSDAADVIEQWRLPDALAEWQVQLADSNGPVRDLDGNPALIDHQSRVRTIDGIHCSNCGTATTSPGEDASRCPVCGSDNVEAGPTRTSISDQGVPFVVTEDEARGHLLEYAGDDSSVLQMNRVFVPYWVFDLDARTTFDAERGINRDFAAVPPKLEWEPVKDEFNLATGLSLVPAGAVPVGRGPESREWYWELDNAEPVERIDTNTANVALDRPIQAGFEQVASDLRFEIEGEIADRVGGHDQRNISADTRYRSISAYTVLLPHWYASVQHPEGQAGLLVNGQTGAVRPLSLPGAIQLQKGNTSPMSKRTYENSERKAGTSLAASVFAGIGIGLMVGALLGLANPPLGEGQPTVAIFIGAVGAVLAALLGLNDRHFTTAKALRIGSFGLAVVIAAPIGIYVRDHQLLAPDLPGPLRSVGGQATAAVAASRRGGLHSTETTKLSCDNFADQRNYWEESDFESRDVIDSIRNLIDVDAAETTAEERKWIPLLDAVQDEIAGDDQKKLLFIAQDASCDSGNFEGNKLLPSDEICQASKGIDGQPGSNLVGSLPAADRARVDARIATDLTPAVRTMAVRLLGEFLCR